MKKWIIGVGTTTLTALFVGLIAIIFTLARGQQNIFRQEPNYSAADYYEKGQQQIDKQDYKQAEQYLEKALSKQDSPEYRNQLALTKYHLGKYQESIDQYQLLIKAGQDKAFAWNGIGNSYRDWAEQINGTDKDRLRADAAGAYQKALKENPQYAAAYVNLAILQVKMGDAKTAAATLDQGIAVTGRDELKQTKKNLGL